VKQYAFYSIAAVAITWAVISLIEKISGKQIPARIKVISPILIGVIMLLVISKDKIISRILSGVVVGAIASSAYDLILDKLLKVMDGFLESIVNKVKQ
jgi:hypothetical protein